ncbi:hypothetical protein [Zhongshania sp. BJYM1]|uniref:hypothetical protein n=1 Tax=Zhongshania aquatica TaxID=2965069 RepID=UPI0022B2CBC4|nr:hypothetical protein [Marortus sp. BJYM1]
MRNITLNVFVISGLLGFGGLYYYSGEVEDHYKDNANRYLKASLAKISSWDVQDLKSELGRETLDEVSDEQLQQLTDNYRHLGAFTSMDEPLFSRLSGALSILNHPPKLSYSSNVRFEHGSAIMTATLTLENQHFKYYNLNLGKPASE